MLLCINVHVLKCKTKEKLMTQPNVDPKQVYGEDLGAVFGPKMNRKHIRVIKSITRREIINKIPKYVDTTVLGDDPTLFQVCNLVLSVLKRCRALQGVDLDWINTEELKAQGLVRCDEQFKPVSKVVKNNKAQRGIQLQHLVEDILFKFNPEWVLMGLARYSEISDQYFLNDAQHRFVACVLLGIRDLPLEYKVSELRSDDVAQYTAVNLNSLVASEYDKYRAMVQTVTAKMQEDLGFNIESMDRSFVNAFNIFNVLSQYGAKLIEKGGEQKTQPLECTGAYNLIRHYDDYGQEIFERAVAIHVEVFNKAPIQTPNIWGICEFIKLQEAEGVLDNVRFTVDPYIVDALLHRYPTGIRNGFHLEAKRSIKEGPAVDLNIPEQSRIAAGLHKIIKITAPEIVWAPVKFSGKVVADEYMNAYKIPPVQQAA
tara:strand:- start:547 stop:1830 length:1284 start_codon:yes stop_codon:yes gene_type:complete